MSGHQNQVAFGLLGRAKDRVGRISLSDLSLNKNIGIVDPKLLESFSIRSKYPSDGGP